MKIKVNLVILNAFFLTSCGFTTKNESNLSTNDLKRITDIVPLEEHEEIQLFESNGGFKGIKTSGNLVTSERLASYWIDGKHDEVHALKYTEIDSIKPIDRVSAVTYASYLNIYGSNQENFKVYIDADSSRTWTFFNKAMSNWKAKRNRTSTR